MAVRAAAFLERSMRTLAATVLTLCGALIGGCPAGGNGGDNSNDNADENVFALTGRFIGVLECTQANSAPDSEPVEYQQDLVVEIRDNGEILINSFFYYLGAVNPITLYDYTSTDTVSILNASENEILIQINTTSFLQDDDLGFEGTKTITLTPAGNGGLNYSFRWFDTTVEPAAPFAVETDCETVLGPAPE